MAAGAWVGERQPRARQHHGHPSATSGIDEIDCGGCITESFASCGVALSVSPVRGGWREWMNEGEDGGPDSSFPPTRSLPPLKRKRVRKHCY